MFRRLTSTAPRARAITVILPPLFLPIKYIFDLLGEGLLLTKL
jgi:hypothetical protein